MTVIEIEDYYGSTIMAFRIKQKITMKDIIEFSECDVADEDKDYLFNTKDNLIRIQKNER